MYVRSQSGPVSESRAPQAPIVRRLQPRTTLLDPAAPATAASPETNPSSDSASPEARVGELERRLQVVVTHIQLVEALTDLHYRVDVWAGKLVALDHQLQQLRRLLAGLADNTDPLPASFLDTLD